MSELKKLPKGWQWVKLEDVCKENRKIINSISSLPYLSLEHIESNTGKILKELIGNIADKGISTTFEFDERHILYGKLRPYLNKVALPDFKGRCTTECIPILPVKEKIDKLFLTWILRRKETVNYVMQEKTGSRMPRADIKHLMSLEIPLPPLPEQKRLATLLTEKLAGVERLKKTLEEQLQAINLMPSAILRQAFNGKL